MTVLLIGDDAIALRATLEVELEGILARQVDVKPLEDIPAAMGLRIENTELILLHLTRENLDEALRISTLKWEEYYPGIKVVCMVSDSKLGEIAERHEADAFVNMNSNSMFLEIAEFLKVKEKS